MLLCDAKNLVGFVVAKALDESEFEGIKPEFRSVVVTLNMDVRRFEPVGQVKEEAETAFAQDRGHLFIVGFLAGSARSVQNCLTTQVRDGGWRHKTWGARKSPRASLRSLERVVRPVWIASSASIQGEKSKTQSNESDSTHAVIPVSLLPDHVSQEHSLGIHMALHPAVNGFELRVDVEGRQPLQLLQDTHNHFGLFLVRLGGLTHRRSKPMNLTLQGGLLIYLCLFCGVIEGAEKRRHTLLDKKADHGRVMNVQGLTDSSSATEAGESKL